MQWLESTDMMQTAGGSFDKPELNTMPTIIREYVYNKKRDTDYVTLTQSQHERSVAELNELRAKIA
jgi:hypothetical protein